MNVLGARSQAQARALAGGLATKLLDRVVLALMRVGRRLGRPMIAGVPVSAVMLTRLQTIGAAQSLQDAAQLLVASHRDSLPVVDDGARVSSVITRGDLATALTRSGPHERVAAAPRHPAVTVAPSDSLADVLAQLRRHPDAVALVVDRGTPVGLLTAEDVLAYARGAA